MAAGRVFVQVEIYTSGSFAQRRTTEFQHSLHFMVLPNVRGRI